MSYARIGNRIGRYGKRNPGRKHLSGDVPKFMQDRYAAILASMRARHEYGSDRKRKQVAAATVRKMMRENPSGLRGMLRQVGIATDDQTRAELLSESFHGRPVEESFEVAEPESYDTDVAVLGCLEELGILIDDHDEDALIPIRFSYGENNPDTVYLASDPYGNNLEFIGGDQSIDWRQVDGAEATDKYLVAVGPVLTVAYFADKHHLEGPKSQARGVSYEHEFGEEGGELPILVYDTRNVKMLLVGGSYTIEPEGITN
jgi:hypothetical protein